MAKVFASYQHLPEPVHSALMEIEQFIGEVDGKTIASETGDNCFIDEGTICADDSLIDAFNTIVAAVSPSNRISEAEGGT